MAVIGRYRVYERQPNGLLSLRVDQQNTLMVSWGFAAAKTLGVGDRDYRISKLYVEYENVVDPNDVVSVPSYSPFDGREYYDNLSAPRDYLRIPIITTPTVEIADGYENYFTEGESGNKIVVFGITAGNFGVNGVPFGAANNSKIFGVALVASPDESDRTKDVLISRGYFDTSKQFVKQASMDAVISWQIKFLPDV